MDRRSLLPPTRASDYADSLRSSITDSASNMIGPLLADKPWAKEKHCWVCDTVRGMGYGKARLYGCKFCLHAVCDSCSPARLFHALTQKPERMCSLCLESEKGEEAAHLAVEEKTRENNELRLEVRANRENLSTMREMRDMLDEDYRAHVARSTSVDRKTDSGVNATVVMWEIGIQNSNPTLDSETQVVISTCEVMLECRQDTKEAALETEAEVGKEQSVQTKSPELMNTYVQTMGVRNRNKDVQCEYRSNPGIESQTEEVAAVDQETQENHAGMVEEECQWDDRIDQELAYQAEFAMMEETMELQCEELMEGETAAEAEAWLGSEEMCPTNQSSLIETEGMSEVISEKTASMTDIQVDAKCLPAVPSDFRSSIANRAAASKERQRASPQDFKILSESQLTAAVARLSLKSSAKGFAPSFRLKPKLSITSFEVGSILPTSLQNTQNGYVCSSSLSIQQSAHLSINIPAQSMSVSEPTIKRKAQITSPFPQESGSNSPKSTNLSEFNRSTMESQVIQRDQLGMKTESREVQTEVTTEDVTAAFVDMEDLTAKNEVLLREIEEYQSILDSIKAVDPIPAAATLQAGAEMMSAEEQDKIAAKYAENQMIQSLLIRLKTAERELYHIQRPNHCSIRDMKTIPPSSIATKSCRCVVF